MKWCEYCPGKLFYQLLKILLRIGRHDTQHNDTQHNDIQQHNYNKHNDIQHNYNQHLDKKTLDAKANCHYADYCFYWVSHFIVMLGFVMLDAVIEDAWHT